MASLVSVRGPATERSRSTHIRVLLLVGNRLLHEELLHIFRKRRGFLIVGEGWERDARASDLLDSNCDVLVIESLSAQFLPAFGLDSLTDLAFKAVLIGMDADEQQFLAAVRSGVTGYLLKDASASDLVAAVRAVSRGEAVCPPQLTSALFRFVAKAYSETSLSCASGEPCLTSRQQQLAALVAKGLAVEEIASQLNLSSHTVRNHIHRIRKRLDGGRCLEVPGDPSRVRLSPDDRLP